MKLPALLVAIAAAGLPAAAPAAEPLTAHPLIKKLAAVVREHFPDAVAGSKERESEFKHGTMLFTLHSKSKTGRVYERTYQQEGPNYMGFVLKVTLSEGEYRGAAVVPQTLNGPYFPTYIDAIPTKDGKGYYWVSFSYGGRLDPEFKKAVFAALPNRFAKAPGFPKK